MTLMLLIGQPRAGPVVELSNEIYFIAGVCECVLLDVTEPQLPRLSCRNLLNRKVLRFSASVKAQKQA